MIAYVIQEIGGNENSPYSLKVMVYCHYHGENRVLTRKRPSMLYAILTFDCIDF